MIISIILVCILILLGALAAIDHYFLNNKLHFSNDFNEGFKSVGATVLIIAGILVWAPHISSFLNNTFGFLENLSIAPSVIPSMFISIDMGGNAFSQEMTHLFVGGVSSMERIEELELLGDLNGFILGCSIGAIFGLFIPLFCSHIKSESKYKTIATGTKWGILMVPFGYIVGGLMFGLNIITILINLIIPLSIIIIFWILFTIAPKITIKFLLCLSKVVTFFAISGIFLGLFQELVLEKLEVEIEFFTELNPLSHGFEEAGLIGMILIGTYVLADLTSRVFRKIVPKMPKKYGLSDKGWESLLMGSISIHNYSHHIAHLSEKEQIVGIAFLTGTASIIGDDLAYAYSQNFLAVLPLIVSKLVIGFLALVLVLFVTRKLSTPDTQPIQVQSKPAELKE